MAAERRPPRAAPRDALERLYVYCAVGAILFALGLLVVSFLATGRLDQLASELERVSEQLARVEAQFDLSARRGTMEPFGRGPTTSGPTRTSRPAPERGSAASRPSTASAAPTPGLSQSVAKRLYERSVETPPTGIPVLRDRAAAQSLLDAGGQVMISDLDGVTCRVLAVSARLLGDDVNATRYADRAVRFGVDVSDYVELTARQYLDAGRLGPALAAARELSRVPRRSAQAALLMARAFLAQRQPADARAAIAALAPGAALDVNDRLALCAVQVELEQWPALERTLNALVAVPSDLTDERDLFRAVSLSATGGYPEAVAVLDVLLDAHADWYDAHLWRGIALMRARQPEAARQSLTRATRVSAGRPEAWYWLGVLEVNEGATDGAAYFHNALAASTRFAPAWEALATQALNGGELHTAAENSRRAVESDPGRSSAHFLLAICEARDGRRDQAARSLRSAFELDPSLVEQAARIDTFLGMFTASELAALAPPRAAASAPASAAP